MSRLLGVFALCAALTACTAEIPGVPTTRTLPDLATVDGCSLLGQWDFPKPFLTPPEPLPGALSCQWTTEGLTLWVNAQDESLEEAKTRVGGEGSPLTVGGRKAWWGVTTDRDREPQTSTGVVVTELAADRVLVVRAKRTPPRYDIGMVARTRSESVLQRLRT